MSVISSTNGGCYGSDGCNGGGDDESGEPPNIRGRTVGGGLIVSTTAPADPALNKCAPSSADISSVGYTNDEGQFDFDRFLQTTLGEFGRYQQFIVWFLCIPACFLSAYSTLDMVFMAYTPQFTCNAPASFENLKSTSDSTQWFINNSSFSLDFQTTSKDNCHFRVLSSKSNDTDHVIGTNGNIVSDQLSCSSWNYSNQYFQRTIVTDWNLVCDKAIAARSIVSLLNVAILFAAVYTYIEDRWGRKRAFLINLAVFLTGSSSSLLAPSPVIFGLLKFVGGITCMWEICYTWALEFVGPSQRTALTTMLSVIYCVATMSLALLAYLCNTWVELGLCTCAPFALLFTYAFFIPESPRWLLTQGRVDEALRVMESMARWQKVKIDLVALRETITGTKANIINPGGSSTNSSAALLVQEEEYAKFVEEKNNTSSGVFKIKVVIDDERSTNSEDTGSHKSLGIGEFFASPNLRWKSFFMTLIEVVANQLYYAIPYSVENLSANFYISYVLQAAVEAPATLLNLLLLNRFGRVVPLSTSMFLSGVCCLLTLAGSTLFSGWTWGPVLLVVLSRFFICTAVAIIEQLTGELFPTVARGTGQGVSYFVSALASISTQYILYAGHVWDGLPMLIFGNVIVVASVMVLFLPETMGKSLPDTVRQAEAQGAVGWESFKGNVPKLLACLRRRYKRKLYKLPGGKITTAELFPNSKA